MARAWKPLVEVTPSMTVAELAAHVEANRISLLFHDPEHLQEAVMDFMDGEHQPWHDEPPPPDQGPCRSARIEKWAAKLIDGTGTLADAVREGLNRQEITAVLDRWVEATE